MSWNTDRREPYTVIGISRLLCIRCQAPAFSQWNICSDAGRYRPLCFKCDMALNRLVLEWMGHPQAAELMQRYESKQTSIAELRKRE